MTDMERGLKPLAADALSQADWAVAIWAAAKDMTFSIAETGEAPPLKPKPLLPAPARQAHDDQQALAYDYAYSALLIAHKLVERAAVEGADLGCCVTQSTPAYRALAAKLKAGRSLPPAFNGANILSMFTAVVRDELAGALTAYQVALAGVVGDLLHREGPKAVLTLRDLDYRTGELP